MRGPTRRLPPGRRLPLVLLSLVLGPRVARAQAPTGAGPSFLIARYASQSALAMYSGYTTGAVFFVAGMLQNPRSDYRELMLGVGRGITARDGDGLTLVPAVASTNTGWYGQLYLLPTLTTGDLYLTATVQFTEPMSAQGTRAAYVSPGNALYDVGAGFKLGVGYYGSFERGSAASHGAGPAVQRAIPHGSLTLELIKGLVEARDEVRVTVRSSF